MFNIPKVNATEFSLREFTSKIDHFNKTDNRTFKMRYFVNNRFFNDDIGPMFLYLCGEYACEVN